tara:strand:+ start:308 stop:1585 length:1278 start_codon:yes stop_codon:yes gene_type:complete
MHSRNRYYHQNVLPEEDVLEDALNTTLISPRSKQSQQQQSPSSTALSVQMLFVFLLAFVTFTYSELDFFSSTSTSSPLGETSRLENDDEYVEKKREGVEVEVGASFDDDTSGEKEASSSFKNVLVSCPTNNDVNKVNPVDFETDLDYVLENFKRTETTSDPFEEIVYVCNVFPPELYEKMLSDFPLIASMEPTEKGRCSEAGDWKLAKCKSYSAAGSNQFKDLRWKLSGYDVIDPKNRVEKSGFRDFESAKETWRRVEQILFSERFQNLVYDKLKLPEGWRDKMITGNVPTDFRLQTDKMGENGYAIGVHPDTPKKLATMQFYFPGLHGGDEKKQESKYGTCVHTAKQFEERDRKNNNAAPCEKKFGFRHNSMYAFKVHETSYHSVEKTLEDAGERNTLLVNWYRDVPQKLATKQKRRTKGRGLM